MIKIHNKVALANVVGHVFGDGSMSQYLAIIYTNTKRELIDDFINNFNIAFNFPIERIKTHIQKHDKNKDCFVVTAYSRPIYLFLGENFFPKYKKSIENSLPFKTSKEKNAFLQAIFDDDGSVSKKGTISITQNVEVINYISKLLNEFGIKNKQYLIKNKIINKNYPALRVSKWDNKKFLKHIGFIHPAKQERLKNNILTLPPSVVIDNRVWDKKMKIMKIKCNHCGYIWKTKSKLLNITCPSCLKKIKVHQKNGGMKDVKDN